MGGDAATDGSTGGEGGGSDGGCRHLTDFATHAVPLLVAHCTECHDNGKLKATIQFNLSDLTASADGQADGCASTLRVVDGAALDQSPLFASSNPAVVDEHDFKFETAEGFEAFRAGILAWLTLELEGG